MPQNLEGYLKDRDMKGMHVNETKGWGLWTSSSEFIVSM